MLGRLYRGLYAKVRAWLIGGAAGAALAGAIQWAIAQACDCVLDEWAVALITTGAGHLVGFVAAYMKPETGPVVR